MKERVHNQLHQVRTISHYILEPTQQIMTDRTKPDIILRDRKGTCLLIDVSITSDKNLNKSETEKEIKANIYWLNHRTCGRCMTSDTRNQKV
jgi:hypothetical protein